MSHYLNDLIPNCPELQSNLEDTWALCDPNMAVSERMPLAEFLTSETNRNGIQQMIHPSSGKLKTVEFLYAQRYNEDHVEENSEAFCTTGDSRGRLKVTYEIDPHQNLVAKATFNKRDFTYNCEKAGSYLNKELMALLDVWRRKAGTVISGQAVALAGGWAANSGLTLNGDNLLVSWNKAETADTNPVLWEDIDEGFIKTGYCAPIFIAGGSVLWKHMRRTAFAGCCANEGLDVGAIFAQYGKQVAYDKRVATALGSENLSLAVQTGALQVGYFAEAGWRDGMAISDFGSNYVLRGIVDPVFSIPLDLYLKDDCPGEITMTVVGVVKVFGLPIDMFRSGDDLEGVTYTGIIETTTNCTPVCPVE